MTIAVHVGGIEHAHAKLVGAIEHGQRLRVVGLAIEFGHAHATQAKLRELRAFGAEGKLGDHDEDSCDGFAAHHSARANLQN